MKAILSTARGGPDTLVAREVPEPEPGLGQLRIAVRAVGVNYPDRLIIEDRYQIRPERPFAPCGECAGVVDAIGPGVEADDLQRVYASAPSALPDDARGRAASAGEPGGAAVYVSSIAALNGNGSSSA